MKLHDFSVLSFDCYGTLIDWESGIAAALTPLLKHASVTREAALERFARHESTVEAETPAMPYPDVLAQVHRRLAREFHVAMDEAAHRRFGTSVPDWPAFPDSAGALRYLKQHYRLVILSNVDRAGFAASNRRLGVAFDAIYTAEDICSYKPDPANFRYMLTHLAELGVQSRQVLHTAQSLFHDHVPAQDIGLRSAWIDRRHDRQGGGATAPIASDVRPDFRFTSLAAMAEAHRTEAHRAER